MHLCIYAYNVYISVSSSVIYNVNFVSGHVGSARVWSGCIGSGLDWSGWVGSGRVGPDQVGSSRVELTRIGSARFESGCVESGRVRLCRTDSGRVEPHDFGLFWSKNCKQINIFILFAHLARYKYVGEFNFVVEIDYCSTFFLSCFSDFIFSTDRRTQCFKWFRSGQWTD